MYLGLAAALAAWYNMFIKQKGGIFMGTRIRA